MGQRYLRQVFTIFLGLLLFLGGVNFLVDPFDLYRAPKIEGFNAEKTEVYKHVRMIKAHAVRMRPPAGIILGTSRAEYGLDPTHSAWSASAQPVYNLALPSGRIREAFLYLLHAQAQGGLNQVVLGVDLFMFDAEQQAGEGFDSARLDSPHQRSLSVGWLRDLFNALFSMDALRASLDTIRHQGDEQAILYRRDGARLTDLTWQQIRGKGGHRAAFLANSRHALRAADGWPLFSLWASPEEPSSTLGIFAQLVRFCLDEGIELRVIISPAHARKLEMIRELGLWELFEYWKLRLTTIVDTENQRVPGTPTAQIWDFSGYNAITTEPVPALSDRDTRMRWYWEGSHYRREVGDRLLDCVLGGRHGERCALGQVLTPANIQNWLTEIRVASERYRRDHQEDVAEIQQMVRDTEAERERLRRRHGWRLPSISSQFGPAPDPAAALFSR